MQDNFNLRNFLYSKTLFEAYQGSLKPKTVKTLKAKSAQSLKDMLKGKSFMQAAMDSMTFLAKVQILEAPYKDVLEELAKEVVYEEFPIVKEAGIKINARLVEPEELNMKQSDDKPDEDISNAVDNLDVDKRRLINAITQGASIRGTKSYYLFKDIVDDLDPTLIDNYNELLANAYGIYDDDNAVSMMMAMLSQNAGNQGGESDVEWDEYTQTLTINAKALVFPILIHEIIKGLYEIVSLQGFTSDAEKNKEIVSKVDKATNEPEDLRYGKFIYDALRNHVSENPKLLEKYLIEVYKLPNTDFKDFIENSINDELTDKDKYFIKKTLQKLQ